MTGSGHLLCMFPVRKPDHGQRLRHGHPQLRKRPPFRCGLRLHGNVKRSGSELQPLRRRCGGDHPPRGGPRVLSSRPSMWRRGARRCWSERLPSPVEQGLRCVCRPASQTLRRVCDVTRTNTLRSLRCRTAKPATLGITAGPRRKWYPIWYPERRRGREPERDRPATDCFDWCRISDSNG